MSKNFDRVNIKCKNIYMDSIRNLWEDEIIKGGKSGYWKKTKVS